MADQEPKPAGMGELKQEIAGFEKDKLHKTKTEEKVKLPDAATIEEEKRAAKEAAQ